MKDRSKQEFWLKRLFHSSWLFAIVLVLLGLFSVALFREMMRKMEIQDEIKALEDQVGELDSKNTELESMIQYFQTEEFVEKEAREKLGFKKAGETVVAVPTNTPFVGAAGGANKPSTTAVAPTNWQLWRDYFFNSN